MADCHEPPLAVWLAINRDLRGEAKETLAAQQARLESLALPCFAVALNFGEETVCVGLGIMEQDHFGVFSVFTPPGQCGRGYGTRVTRALLAIGQRENARVAFLQVDEANAAALHLYTAVSIPRQSPNHVPHFSLDTARA
ncbi:MAG TPA: GNAT family N-acetyltransferase [Gemmatimonadaceae bacterium]|nr:GNAT family N-acetyltransferase [Gemmatimonadaceae bacterium]